MRDRHQILHHFLLGGDLLSTSNSLPCLRHRCCNSSNPKRANRSLWATTSIATSTADRKSTRLNSSHSQISYAVFCLKKKKVNRIATNSKPSSSSIVRLSTT